MNTTKAIAAAQKYLGVEATATSFNGLMLQVANKYLTNDRTALADAALDALNLYLTNDRRALSDAMYDAAIQYLAGDDRKGDAITAALDKYLTAPSIPTYEQYQAAIAAFATDGARTADFVLETPINSRCVLNGASPNLTGSSWNTEFGLFSPIVGLPVSNIAGIARHAFPSDAVRIAQEGAGREVYLKVTAGAGAFSLSAFDRNNFVSSIYDGSEGAGSTGRLDFFAYYDPTLGPVKVNARLGLGPIPWDMVSTVY